jgi:NTE family protein
MPTSIFDGLPSTTLHHILDGREQHTFVPGETIILEGERVERLHVIQSGEADVYLVDAFGSEHLLNRVGAGSALGEMSVATGQPASATVRASDRLETVSLTPNEFREVADRYPQIHWNITAILAERLARADRRALEAAQGKITILQDRGAPPLVGYALACSAAWHAGRSVLQLILSDGAAPDEIRGLASIMDEPDEHAIRALSASARGGSGPRAYLVHAPLKGMFAPDRIEETVKDLSRSFVHVFVEIQGHPPPNGFRSIQLTGRHEGPDGTHADARFHIRAWVDEARVERPRNGLVVVPRPSGADEHALGRGILPLRTGVGSALGYVARDVTGTSVGLALGAGSWKGYAHIGVLRALERLGVPIDYVAGASIGSVVATTVAKGYDWERCAEILDAGGSVAWFPTVPVGGLMSPRRLYGVVRRVVGDEGRFENLPIPLAIVTADIDTHSEVIFRHGLIAPALMASMSIPGVYPAMHIGPYTLVDGGVVNPVPASAVAEMGAHKVIAVRLSLHGAPQHVLAEGALPSGRPPLALNSILRSIDMMQSRMSLDTAAGATITLAPDFSCIKDPGLRHFVAGRAAIDRGEAAVEGAIEEIGSALPWLTRHAV